MSMNYSLDSKDEFSKTNIEKNIQSALALFGGKFKIKNSPRYHPMTFGQAVNFFHIPTQANFVKGLEYTIYRKLPYPTSLPTIKNTNEKELTILGKTHYRGENIEFGIKREDKFRHYYIV
jgi:hypothetical protein